MNPEKAYPKKENSRFQEVKNREKRNPRNGIGNRHTRRRIRRQSKKMNSKMRWRTRKESQEREPPKRRNHEKGNFGKNNPEK